MRSDVSAITSSVLTTQARRSLRAWDIAKAKHAADMACGLAPCVKFCQLRPHERELYLAEAYGELATPPQFPTTEEEPAHV